MQIAVVGPESGGLISIGSQANGIVAIGQSATGVIAIGQLATGVIAFGQVATGVIAVGQVARGGIAVGQLALGLVSVGMLSVGVLWSAGLVGIGATSGPGFVLGLFGRLYLRRRQAGPLPRIVPRGAAVGEPVAGRAGFAVELTDNHGAGRRLNALASGSRRTKIGMAATVVIAAVWCFGAGAPLIHDLPDIGTRNIPIETPGGYSVVNDDVG